MARHRFPLVFILLTAAIWGGCAPRPLTSGPAPDFTLGSLNGDAVTLSDLEGQVVLLDFWATWCRPCLEGLNHLQKVHERYTDQGVVVLAINVGEERDEVAEFVVGHSYTFSVLLDTDGGVSDAYGVHIIPHTVVVDREGEMQYLAGGLDDVEEALRRVMVE